jgi:hypothetical protein
MSSISRLMSSSFAANPPFTPILSVISRYHPSDLSFADDNDDDDDHHHHHRRPILKDEDVRNDGWDPFNHPRFRRALILRELAAHSSNPWYHNDDNDNDDIIADETADVGGDRDKHQKPVIAFYRPPTPSHQSSVNLKDTVYSKVHTLGLLDFLSTGWARWDALGEAGQDPVSTKKMNLANEDIQSGSSFSSTTTLPLIPGNFVLPRNDPYQRPSQNVMGQVGYYCTDTCTPIFAELLEELLWDMETIQMAVNMVPVGVVAVTLDDHPEDEVSQSPSSSSTLPTTPLVYALCTHPGHHATKDAFGGYCYLNHSALAARLLQERLQEQQRSPTSTSNTVNETPKVAILDVDYHCGNGSASIFYDDPSVLVISIHCHPDWDYPFHSGWEDERGVDRGVGTTVHLPLLPGTTWKDSYQPALEQAMQTIQSFGAQGLILSLGLDTYAGDPCAIRRAGFLLQGHDYKEMGRLIGKYARMGSTNQLLPVVVVQEGGYKMDKVPIAVSDVLLALAESLES